MSRVGKMPVVIPQGVEVTLTNLGSYTNIKIKGPKGTISKDFFNNIKIEKADGHLVITRSSEDKPVKSLHGTYRALIHNMIVGVTTGFEKQLTWEGVGYRMQPKGKGLVLQMGYSHEVEFSAVEGIDFKLDNNVLTICGVDKAVVGQTAANIRMVRGPEPYKGKGIRYSDEVIIRKAGKAAK